MRQRKNISRNPILKKNASLNSIKTHHKFSSQELDLLKKAYNNEIKNFMPFSHYLIFLDVNAKKIKNLL